MAGVVLIVLQGCKNSSAPSTPTEPEGETVSVAAAPTQTSGQPREISDTATATPHPTLTATATRTPRPTRTRRPTRTPTITPTPSPLDCLNVVYLADVTIPDGSHLDKGESFVKTWRVRNNGSCPWPEDTRLVFVSGHQMSAPDSVSVGTLAAGETTEISVNMVAPDADDHFQGTWRCVTGEGDFYGTRLTVIIGVGEQPTGVPTSTPGPGSINI